MASSRLRGGLPHDGAPPAGPVDVEAKGEAWLPPATRGGIGISCGSLGASGFFGSGLSRYIVPIGDAGVALCEREGNGRVAARGDEYGACVPAGLLRERSSTIAGMGLLPGRGSGRHRGPLGLGSERRN